MLITKYPNRGNIMNKGSTVSISCYSDIISMIVLVTRTKLFHTSGCCSIAVAPSVPYIYGGIKNLLSSHRTIIDITK